jgi:hypothetical protein
MARLRLPPFSGLAAAFCAILLASHAGAEENLARNRAAYQSSSIDDDRTAHLATDGSTETAWESKPDGEQWISVDLGEVCPIDRIQLRWGQAYATAYRIQVSTDGLHPAAWKDVQSTTDGRGGAAEIHLAAVKARHVRVLASAFSIPGRGGVLEEFEVYGSRSSQSTPAPQPPPAANGTLTLTGGAWKLQNARFVASPPERIAAAGFDDSEWLRAVVPGTVLGSYLAAGAVPDPWYGDQMSQISEAFFSHNDFWYRDAFTLPADFAGKRIWLVFDGINWKADVFLNGTAVGRIDGAFIRGRFDVTALARPGQANHLAVRIHQVANPGPGKGKVTHKTLGASTTNGDVLGLDSPTFVASAGWNWLPIVRGRNIGIWNNVRVETSGDVTLIDPWVASKLPLPDTSKAALTVKVELFNHSGTARRGMLVGTIGDITFRQDVTVPPMETKAVTLDKTTCPQLEIAHPKLWWPNGYGSQPLYRLKLRFESGGVVSDRREVAFGIRDLDWRVIDGVLTLFANGKRILLRGGNWGMDEGMLRCDREGYDLRVRLHHDANLTMIRNWVGMVGREEFYDACDRYGILIWDDFWLANPGDGPNPTDAGMFLANARDKIRRVRSHPSLALYCGRNEGNPPPELDVGLKDAVGSLDGTRQYIPHSAAGTVSGFGPYEMQDPEWYFANRGKTLHSEQGICAVPPVESMRAMLPPESLWPINGMWAIHDYQTPRMPRYTQRIEQRYGKPAGLEDYCRKAQMVNMETSKAMFECLQSRQGSGLLIWMTQPAWPSLICQLYDYYFEMTAAYFGAKKGAEPLHIFWDPKADAIRVANNTVDDGKDLTAEAWIYDLDGRQRWHHSAKISVPSASAKDCFPLERPAGLSSVYFLKLKLSRAGKTLSDNFYWAGEKGGSFADLDKLPRVALSATAVKTIDGPTCRLAVTVKNPTASVALMIRLKVQRDPSGERVLPVFYEDNYFSLLPGETRTVAVSFPAAQLAGEMPRLMEEGWNIVPKAISIR